MVDRKTVRVAVILLVAGAMVELLAGVEAGLHHDWTKMSFMLFACCLSVFFAMNVVAGWRIITSLSRLEGLVLEGTDSGHQATTEAKNVWGAKRANKVIVGITGIFMVATVAVNIAFAGLAGLHQAPFKLGLHLAACAVSAMICMGVLTVLGIGARCRHVEELILERNKSGPSDGQIGGEA